MKNFILKTRKPFSLILIFLTVFIFILNHGQSILAQEKQEEMISVDSENNLKDSYQTASFGMGCFWGSEAAFGALPGVIRTRVGYSGGTSINPTYYDIGDHTETVQVDYDPRIISYLSLLEVFWNHHNPTIKSKKRQYISIIFYHGDKQMEIALRSKEEESKEKKQKIWTELAPFKAFYLAEEYHQKYFLQQAGPFYEGLRNAFPDFSYLNRSTIAARANAFLGGFGDCEQLKKEIDSYKVSQRIKNQFLKKFCDD